LVRVQGEGPERLLHPTAAQPLRRSLEQGVGDLLVVDRVEEAEEPRALAIAVVPGAIDLRRAAPDAASPHVRGEEGALAVAEERVLAAQALFQLEVERPHEMGI